MDHRNPDRVYIRFCSIKFLILAVLCSIFIELAWQTIRYQVQLVKVLLKMSCRVGVYQIAHNGMSGVAGRSVVFHADMAKKQGNLC